MDWIHGFLQFWKKKLYLYSSFLNVFVFSGQKMKSIRIRGDINISQNSTTSTLRVCSHAFAKQNV